MILNNLYKHTPLQTNFAVNIVALVDGVPRTLNLRAGAAPPTSTTRSRWSPSLAVPAREGPGRGPTSSRACSRPSTSSTRSSPRSGPPRTAARRSAALMAEPFEFSEIQADHILEMQLGRLTRLGRVDLETEIAELRDDRRAARRSSATRSGFARSSRPSWARSRRSSPRRAAPRSPTTRATSTSRTSSTTRTSSSRSAPRATSRRCRPTCSARQGRGGRGVTGTKLRDEDYVIRILTTTAHAYLLFFSNHGRVYRLKAHEIPRKERTAPRHRDRQPVAAATRRADRRRSSTPATTRPTSTCSSRPAKDRSRRPSSPTTTRRCGPGSSPSTCTTATSSSRSSPPTTGMTSSWSAKAG